MKRRRRKARELELCSGPAKLAQALAIDRSLDGIDLATSDSLYVARGRTTQGAGIIATSRVGVSYAENWAKKRLRFLLEEP
jgi:DNA-3-methyladenine glycosylase